MTRRLIAAMAVCIFVLAMCVGVGMASAVLNELPKFARARLERALESQGVTVCAPGGPKKSNGLGEEYQVQDIKLYAKAKWPTCPRRLKSNDPNFSEEEQEASIAGDGELTVRWYRSQKALDRGAKMVKWFATLFKDPGILIGWKWPPVIIELHGAPTRGKLQGAPAPEIIAATTRVMQTLNQPSKPKLFMDNR